VKTGEWSEPVWEVDTNFDYDRNTDFDYDPRQSTQKSGGYNWAGGYIDPSPTLRGYVDHPTMSPWKSQQMQKRFQRKALDWKNRQRNQFEDEDDSFDL